MNDGLKNKDYQNDWANNLMNNPVHIDNAESGAKGYYCMGCGKEMQAVKSKNPNHQSYFRHHVYNVDKDTTECVVASKVYREQLAEEILHRLKELKVPDLFKYPPQGMEGLPMLIEESKVVSAHKVRSQLSFYEDSEGIIKWGKNPEIDERYLLIRPDVTFFDVENNPILFIEFVITHKISDEKKVKLSRIGIDTVQIIIPKRPESEIEKSLKSVKKVKWVYNAIEANTKYISVPKGDSERVFPVDEEQRKLLEESFACTAAKIGNLIRSITRSLGGQSYRNAEFLIEQEISRIEKATKREEEELGEMEKQFEEEVRKGIERKNKKLEAEEREFGSRRGDFSEYRDNLERRYLRKARELREKEEEIREKEFGIRHAIEECRKIGTTKAEVERGFRIEKESIQKEFEAEIGRIGEDLKFQQRIFNDN